MTASCAAVKAARTPKLKRLARKTTVSAKSEVRSRSVIEITPAATIASGGTSVRRLSRPKARGSCPCSPSECASRVNPEIDVVTATSRMTAPVSPTYMRSAVTRSAGTCPCSAATIPIIGEVGDRLEAGVREHRQRQREGNLVPRRLGADRDPTRERVAREQEREAERDQAELRDEVEDGDDDPVAVEGRAAAEPDEAHADDHADRDDEVPRMMRERADLEGRAEVVRQEEGRERDHDQVVEEQRPAGQEAGEVVERAPDEGRGAARLRDRGGALGVRERDDEEEGADEREHLRCEAERVQGDDSERDVDRGGDLAVRDREQRRRVEDPLESGDLARHGLRLLWNAVSDSTWPGRDGSSCCSGPDRGRRTAPSRDSGNR